MDCLHENFVCQVKVDRLTQFEGGPVTGYSADITVHCGACGVPFQWVGVPGGLAPDHPTCSVDNRELRAPLRISDPWVEVPTGMRRSNRPAEPGVDVSDPNDHGFIRNN